MDAPRQVTGSAALAIRGLEKSYGETRAVAGLDLTVQGGEIVGLIGPDGAGKTTTMRIALGLLRADAGTVTVFDIDATSGIQGIKERLGYMPQRFSLYPDLTVAENLRFFSDLYLVPKQDLAQREQEMLAFSRLEPFRHRRAGALSGGMKQKLALSCNLVHRPDLLILDEPTTGVDPVSRQEFWQWLRRFAEDGLAILVSTPYMDEAELCDRVALVHEGRVLASGTPSQVTARFPGGLLRVEATRVQQAAPVLQAAGLAPDAAVRFGDSVHVTHPVGEGPALAARLAEAGIEAESIDPSIEDVFVALVTAAEGGPSSATSS